MTMMELPPHLVQCATCGVERSTDGLPDVCPICADERQYVPLTGQRWVDPADFTGRIELTEREPGLWGLDVVDGTGIGQQAKLIVTDGGNVLFDVPPAITDEAVDAVRRLGDVRGIIASHPHMYGLQSAWSHALGDALVYVSAADRSWLGYEPAQLRVWDDTIEILPGVVASQPGGHFPGSVVVHWPGRDGKGVVLAGDTLFVNPDLETVAFMRSYPNHLPLSGAVAERVAAHVGRYEFDRLYGNFRHRLASDAREKMFASARRHAAWVRGDFDHLTGPG